MKISIPGRIRKINKANTNDNLNSKNLVVKKSPKVAAVSLGCDKNRIDTETILNYLMKSGYSIVEGYTDADLIIINTCSFIDDARQESINTLLKLSQSIDPSRTKLVMAGCMVEIYGNRLISQLEELSGAIGVHSYRHLNTFLKAILKGKRITIKRSPAKEYNALSERLLTTSPHSIPVKIAEGCDNCCNYCLIPGIRGKYRSRPPEDIVKEINLLLKAGTKEISLIAQDTTAYGLDKENYPDLTGLIKMIMKLKPYFWLRVMYAYPSRINDNLLELIASDDRICNYLDIPLQHVNEGVLKNMARDYSKVEILTLLSRIREIVPTIALRTTVMIGHPGESKKAFDELIRIINDHCFENLGSFIYSAQKGTAAYNMQGIVPARIAKKRRHILMTKQKEISCSLNRKHIGKTYPVLIDGYYKKANNLYIGRTEFQAPDVDGFVVVKSRKHLRPGDFIKAKICFNSTYNLLAVAIR